MGGWGGVGLYYMDYLFSISAMPTSRSHEDFSIYSFGNEAFTGCKGRIKVEGRETTRMGAWMDT